MRDLSKMTKVELRNEIKILEEHVAELESQIAETVKPVDSAQEDCSFLRAVIENLPFEVWVCGADGRYIIQNALDKAYWGNNIGKTVDELTDWPEETLAQWKVGDQRAFNGEQIRDEGERIVNQERRYYSAFVGPVRVGDTILGIVGATIDTTERVQAEITLRSSEEHYRLLFENNPSPMWVFDIQSLAFLAVNDAAVRHYGYSRQEFSSMTLKDIRPPEDIPALLEDLSNGSSGLGERNTWRHLKKDGTLIDVEITSQIFDWAGRPAGLILATDITERKRIEAALRVSEDKFSKAFHTSPDSININRLVDGRFIDINDGFTKVTGYTREDVIGRTSLEIDIWVNPEDRFALMEALRTSGEVANLEATFRMKGGTKKVGLMSASIIEIDGEQCILSIARDISERKQMEQELRESEERYRLLAENSPTGIVLHKDEKVFYVNRAATKLFGASDPEELIGRHILDFVHPDYRPIVLERAQLVGEQSQAVPMLEEKFLRLNGTSVDVEVAGVPFIYQGKRATQVIINDITERKRSQGLIQLRLRLMEYAATHSLEELLRKTLDEIGELTSSPIGFFHFVDADQQTLSLQTWSTRTLDEFCEAEGEGLHYPVEQAGVWADCIRERRPVIHNDYSSLPNRKGLPDGHAQVVRELVVPILKGDRIKAILGVGNKSQDYTEKDVELVSYLADIAWEMTERRQTEEALRLTQLTVDRAPDAIHWVGGDGKLLYVNDATCQSLGYTREELLSMTIFDIDPSYPKDEWSDHWERERDLGYYTFETIHKTKEGHTLPVEIVVNRVNYEGKEFNCAYARDITERRLAREMLQESEEKFRSIVENALAGIFTVDHAYHFIYANDELCNILGYPKEQLLGMDFRDVLSDDSRDLVAERYVRRQRGEEVPSRYEMSIVRGDGEIRYAEMNVTVVKDKAGNTLSMGQLVDITESRRARKELEDTKILLEATFEQTPVPMVLVSTPDGVIRIANSAAVQFLTDSNDPDPIGQTLSDYRPSWQEFNSEDLPISLTETPLALALQGITTRNEEHSVLRKDGIRRWNLASAAPIYNATGKQIAAFVAFPDITDRKRAEEALQESEFFLKRSQTVARLGSYYFDARTGKWISSPALDEIFGIDDSFPKDVESWIALVHPEQKEEMLNYLSQYVLVGHNRFNKEYRIVRHDNQQVRWMHGLGELEFDEDGNAVKMIGTIQDITERRQVEEALKEKTEELDRFFSVTLDLLCIADTDGYFRRLNPQWEAVLGYSLQELEARRFLDLVHPDDHESTLTVLGDLGAQKAVLNFVNRYRCKDSSYRWLEWRSYPVGNLVYAAARDITERKQAEEALRESQQMLRLVLDTIPVRVFWKDTKLQYLGCNWIFALDAGLSSPQEILGKNDFELGWRDQAELYRADDQAVIKTGLPKISFEEPQTTPEGETIWLQTSKVPLIDASGQIRGVLGTYEDITERKRVEEALRLTRFTVESVADAIYWMNPEAQIVDVNETACRMLEYSRDELIGMSLSDIDPQFNLVQWPNTWKRLKENGRMTTEVQHRTKSGHLIPVEIVANYIEFGDRELDCAVVRDVTERKKMEAALRESEERYRTFVENLPIGVYRTTPGPKGKHLIANSYFLRMFGYDSLEELVQKVNVSDMYQHPAERKVFSDDLLANGHVERAELCLRRSDGTLIWGAITASVAYSKNDEPYFDCVIEDITERKKAEQALRESEERLRQIASSLREVIWLRDIKTRQVLYVNPAFEELTGRTCESFYGNRDIVIDAIHPDDKEEVIKALEQRFESVPFSKEHRIIHLDGSVHWVSSRIFPVRNEAGEVYRWASIMEDITARKQADEKIRQLNEELEQRVIQRTAQLEAANKELEAFSYSISHDLRAPLRAIDGFSRILLEDHASQLSEEAIRLLGIVRDNTQQMGHLIDDLLAFSRLSRQSVEKRAVNTAELVRQVLDTLRNDLDKRKVEIEIGELPDCHGDPLLLKQVWLNLLDNAIKYTSKQEHAKIEIGSLERDGEKIYFVRDNGVGFSMQYAGKLFGVFQRLHRSADFEGTGVGLAIVQRIIHRHGGHVWAEAEPNVGATFYFSL